MALISACTQTNETTRQVAAIKKKFRNKLIMKKRSGQLKVYDIRHSLYTNWQVLYPLLDVGSYQLPTPFIMIDRCINLIAQLIV